MEPLRLIVQSDPTGELAKFRRSLRETIKPIESLEGSLHLVNAELGALTGKLAASAAALSSSGFAAMASGAKDAADAVLKQAQAERELAQAARESQEARKLSLQADKEASLAVVEHQRAVQADLLASRQAARLTKDRADAAKAEISLQREASAQLRDKFKDEIAAANAAKAKSAAEKEGYAAARELAAAERELATAEKERAAAVSVLKLAEGQLLQDQANARSINDKTKILEETEAIKAKTKAEIDLENARAKIEDTAKKTDISNEIAQLQAKKDIELQEQLGLVAINLEREKSIQLIAQEKAATAGIVRVTDATAIKEEAAARRESAKAAEEEAKKDELAATAKDRLAISASKAAKSELELELTSIRVSRAREQEAARAAKQLTDADRFVQSLDKEILSLRNQIAVIDLGEAGFKRYEAAISGAGSAAESQISEWEELKSKLQELRQAQEDQARKLAEEKSARDGLLSGIRQEITALNEEKIAVEQGAAALLAHKAAALGLTNEVEPLAAELLQLQQALKQSQADKAARDYQAFAAAMPAAAEGVKKVETELAGIAGKADQGGAALGRLVNAKQSMELLRLEAVSLEKQLELLKPGSDQARAALIRLEQIDLAKGKLSGEISKISSNLSGVKQNAKSTSDSISSDFKRMAASVAASIAAGFTIKKAGDLLSIADDYNSLIGRIGLYTDSLKERGEVERQIYIMSQLTGTVISDNVNFYGRLSAATKELNLSSGERLKIQDTLNKTMMLSRVSTGEAGSILLQFSQALSKGKLDGDEFRSMAENNVVWTAKLAKQLGVTKGELIEMSKGGRLTVDTLLTAMKGMADEVDSEFGKLPITIGRATQEIKNAFFAAIAGGGTASEGIDKIATSLENVAVQVEGNSPAISQLFDTVVTLADASLRSVSGLAAGVQTLASGASSAYAIYADLRSGQAFLKGDAAAVAEWEKKRDAASLSAIDLAGKATENWKRATRSASEAKAEADAHRAALEKEAAAYKNAASESSKLTGETGKIAENTKKYQEGVSRLELLSAETKRAKEIITAFGRESEIGRASLQKLAEIRLEKSGLSSQVGKAEKELKAAGISAEELADSVELAGASSVSASTGVSSLSKSASEVSAAGVSSLNSGLDQTKIKADQAQSSLAGIAGAKTPTAPSGGTVSYARLDITDYTSNSERIKEDIASFRDKNRWILRTESPEFEPIRAEYKRLQDELARNESVIVLTQKMAGLRGELDATKNKLSETKQVFSGGKLSIDTNPEVSNELERQAGLLKEQINILSQQKFVAESTAGSFELVGGEIRNISPAVQAARSAYDSLRDSSGNIKTEWKEIGGVWQEVLPSGKALLEEVDSKVKASLGSAGQLGPAISEGMSGAAGAISAAAAEANKLTAAAGSAKFDELISSMAGLDQVREKIKLTETQAKLLGIETAAGKQKMVELFTLQGVEDVLQKKIGEQRKAIYEQGKEAEEAAKKIKELSKEVNAAYANVNQLGSLKGFGSIVSELKTGAASAASSVAGATITELAQAMTVAKALKEETSSLEKYIEAVGPASAEGQKALAKLITAQGLESEAQKKVSELKAEVDSLAETISATSELKLLEKGKETSSIVKDIKSDAAAISGGITSAAVDELAGAIAVSKALEKQVSSLSKYIDTVGASSKEGKKALAELLNAEASSDVARKKVEELRNEIKGVSDDAEKAKSKLEDFGNISGGGFSFSGIGKSLEEMTDAELDSVIKSQKEMADALKNQAKRLGGPEFTVDFGGRSSGTLLERNKNVDGNYDEYWKAQMEKLKRAANTLVSGVEDSARSVQRGSAVNMGTGAGGTGATAAAPPVTQQPQGAGQPAQVTNITYNSYAVPLDARLKKQEDRRRAQQ